MPSDRDQSREAGFAEHLPGTLDGLQFAIQGSQPKPKVPKGWNLAPEPVIGKKTPAHPPLGEPVDGERDSQ